MTKVLDVIDYFESRVPSTLKMDFDNVGFLVGSEHSEVTKVLVALDITSEVMREGVKIGAQLIVSHHPIIFKPVRSVTDATETGKKLLALINSGISGICLHTNLDSVAGGVSDELLKCLGARAAGILEENGIAPDGKPYGAGRIGVMPRELTMAEFLRHTLNMLGAEALRYYDAGKTVRQLAVCGGSGGEYLEAALKQGCDTYLTADINYDCFLTAQELGINLIDGGHFHTENVVVPVIARMLTEGFPGLEVFVSEIKSKIRFFPA